VQRDQDRRLDSQGQLKSEKVDVTRMILVNGATLRAACGTQTDGFHRQKNRKNLIRISKELKARNAGRADCAAGKEQENRSFLRDMLDGFDFRLLGERYLAVGQLMCFRPRRTRISYARQVRQMSPRWRQLWIDKSDFGWIKVEGSGTSRSRWIIRSRVQRGSHIILEQKSR